MSESWKGTFSSSLAGWSRGAGIWGIAGGRGGGGGQGRILTRICNIQMHTCSNILLVPFGRLCYVGIVRPRCNKPIWSHLKPRGKIVTSELAGSRIVQIAPKYSKTVEEHRRTLCFYRFQPDLSSASSACKAMAPSSMKPSASSAPSSAVQFAEFNSKAKPTRSFGAQGTGLTSLEVPAKSLHSTKKTLRPCAILPVND